MISFLDTQYLSFRNNWRSVTGLHRMQAVYIEKNQMLKLLGIRGLTLDNLTTETLPDSSNMAQITLSARQYKNIFENIGRSGYGLGLSLAATYISPRARGEEEPKTWPGQQPPVAMIEP